MKQSGGAPKGQPLVAADRVGVDPALPSDASLSSTVTIEPAARSRGVEHALYIGLALAIFAAVAWVVLH